MKMRAGPSQMPYETAHKCVSGLRASVFSQGRYDEAALKMAVGLTKLHVSLTSTVGMAVKRHKRHKINGLETVWQRCFLQLPSGEKFQINLKNAVQPRMDTDGHRY